MSAQAVAHTGAWRRVTKRRQGETFRLAKYRITDERIPSLAARMHALLPDAELNEDDDSDLESTDSRQSRRRSWLMAYVSVMPEMKSVADSSLW